MKRGNTRKFGREKQQRKALFKALATALIDSKKIKTTHAKAKSLSMMMDKLITKAKKSDLAARRILLSNLGTKASDKLIREIAPAFGDRKGGYTKVTRLTRRTSDGSEVSIIEFVQ